MPTETLALLKNKNVVLDADGIKDIKAGRIDPRAVGVLTKLSQEHRITVHQLGRGMDITAIDGEAVSPDSPLAREVASELSSLDPKIRPDEIGSPFAISGPGYFTDAAHQNRLHIGFKEATEPADDAPTAAAPVAPAAAPAVAPGRPRGSCRRAPRRSLPPPRRPRCGRARRRS